MADCYFNYDKLSDDRPNKMSDVRLLISEKIHSISTCMLHISCVLIFSNQCVILGACIC